MRAAVLLTMLLALLLLPRPAVAQERATLTVAPPAGPAGTTFQPRATGLPPGTAVVAIMRLPGGEGIATSAPGPVSPDGDWLPPPWRSREDDPVGQYTVLIATADGATVLADGTFIVTAPSPAEPAPPRPPVQLPGTRA